MTDSAPIIALPTRPGNACRLSSPAAAPLASIGESGYCPSVSGLVMTLCPGASTRCARRLGAAALLALGLLFFSRRAEAKQGAGTSDPATLEVPGYSDAYYIQPRGKSRRSILLYLHGRGGNALEDCRKWARVARPFGWVVCPQGPVSTESGGRTWNNDAETAKRIIDATVDALKEKYKSRVRTRGDILIGFSEGAFIAQQVGMRDPARWNRWLILAANDRYWFGDASQLLEQNREKIRRVYLFTGEDDQVAENTKRAGEMLKEAHIRVKVKIVPGLGHEVPSDRMITNYRRPLRWLTAASGTE